jgi:hypothetical protein
VPHLSESLLIGIERWQFVESDVNEFVKIPITRVALITNVFRRVWPERARPGIAARTRSAMNSTQPLPVVC